MYQKRSIHPLSPPSAMPPAEVVDTLWSLFVAIGEHWRLQDDPAPYRLRFETFIANRIDLNPLYDGHYKQGAALLDALIATHGAKSAFETVFGDKPRIAAAGLPSTPLEALQRFIADEFIALRLAVGGFRSFGALNYPGYIGGANIAGEATPYRTRDKAGTP
jgi:hypothetical protein